MPPKRKANKAPPKTKARKTAVNSKTAGKTQASDTNKTGFLDLAAELRNEVYHLALARSHDILLPDRAEKYSENDELPPVVFHEPALLRTCRQVRQEASAVLYGCKTFSPIYALYGPKLIKQLGPERASLLGSVKVCEKEQAGYVTVDRWNHTAICFANNLLKAAKGVLKPSAILVPVGHAAKEGWVRVTEPANHRVGKSMAR